MFDDKKLNNKLKNFLQNGEVRNIKPQIPDINIFVN